MTVRNLEYLFRPRSVAVVGASDVPGSYGSVVLRNLMGGGFAGPILPVTVKHRSLFGLTAHPQVEKLPLAPDLAILCAAAETVPEVLAQLAARGTRAAILTCPLPAHLRDPHGTPLNEAVLAAARPYLMRVLGPASAGLVIPALGLNASFAHAPVAVGRTAFVSQSAPVTAAVLDWARSRGIGFSCLMHLGESADVDLADALDFLASDPATASILMHFESVVQGRKFMSAARAASRNKPLIAIRPGRVGHGSRLGTTRAAGLFETDDVYADAMRRAGMVRAFTSEGLFEAVEAVARARPAAGNRLAIVANGAGFGRVAADALHLGGGRLARLPADAQDEVARRLPGMRLGNPFELAPEAPAADYAAACRVLLACTDVDAVLVIHAPTAFVPALDIATAIADAAQGAMRSVFTCWLGGDAVEDARRIASQRGLPSYDAPERAIDVFLRIDEYRRNRELLMQMPPSVPEEFRPDARDARCVVETALRAGRNQLAEHEAFDVLRAYGIRVPASDAPQRRVSQRAGAMDFLVGVASDPVFGPIIVAGQSGGPGGPALAVALPPLNMLLARDLVSRMRLGALRREQAPMVDALCLTLVQVSQLIADLDEVVELEIDPLRVDARGVLARHAHMRLAPHRRHQGARRFAIRPYPRELEERVRWQDQDVVVRPIRPEDEVVHGAFLESLAPEDARYRFFSTMRHLPHSELARFTHIDYDREMALIALGPDGEDGLRTLGEVRAVADPDNLSAEFAIVVRSELKGKGLGRLLLDRMIAYQRSRGTGELRGETMLDNERMKSLARDCGFIVEPRMALGVAELRRVLNPEIHRSQAAPAAS